jgi:hypothetical protein
VLGERKAGSRCVPRRLAVGPRGVGKLRLGASRDGVMAALGEPAARTRNAFGWCVTGGGAVVVSFDKGGKARLVATTAQGHSFRGLGARDRAGTLRRAFGKGPRVRGTFRRSRHSTRVLFNVEHKRIRYVAVVDGRALKSRTRMEQLLRNAGLSASRNTRASAVTHDRRRWSPCPAPSAFAPPFEAKPAQPTLAWQLQGWRTSSTGSFPESSFFHMAFPGSRSTVRLRRRGSIRSTAGSSPSVTS